MIEDTIIIRSSDFEISPEDYELLVKFATHAMKGLIESIYINDDEEYNYDLVSKDAFKFAEAMVKTYKDFYKK